MNYWLVSETSFVPNLKRLRSQETVYTIGNGYFCTRGSFEEGHPGDMPATLLFGVFDDIPIAKEELANAPDWTLIQLFIDGERFRLDRGTLLDYQRILDIQRGIVYRSVRWESPQGARLHIQSERFASLADEHVGAIRYSVTLEESKGHKECTIAVWSTINAAEGNYDVLHWECAEQGHQDDIIWLHSTTKHSKVDLAQAMSFTTTNQNYHKEIVDSDTAPSIRFQGTLAPGETFSADKIVTLYTPRDTEDTIYTTIHHLQDLLAVTHVSPATNSDGSSLVDENTIELLPTVTPAYDALLADSCVAWQRFWQTADVIIEGDEKAQIGVRYNIYQLRINVSAHDDRYSVAAKGLTGFGYRGHIFHDTEIFMLPFYTYVMPSIARNLLTYRYHLLPGARQKAANNGYEGAQYPWESTLDGEEATPPAIIHPESGEVISVLNGFIELHITASIAHAVWQYWRVTGDDEFMRDYGAEILLSTAMFWVSRAEEHEERHEYEITNVIGPDEWHEHVNNNVYTNLMARYNIWHGLTALEWLQTTSTRKAEALEQQLKLTPRDIEHWRDVADHLRIDQDLTTKVLEQFDGFFKLATFDQIQYAGRKDSYQGILGMHEVQRYRIIKQADVLMLLTVLNQEFDYETKKANWDYYYPITDHDYGSSLTPALHVILACELGLLDIAYKMFMKGALVDLENLRGNTPEGIHAACSGAVWQAAILGFAGLRISDDGYTTTAQWPDGWTRLAFSFYYKGELIHVDLRK